MSTVVAASKLTGETLDLEIDFLSRLQIGETVMTIDSTVETISGIDASPLSMLSGLPSVSGTLGIQKLVGGLPGVIYKVSLGIRTSLENVLINEAKIAVLTSPVLTP